MSKELFRKVALDRLSSPEQLDQLMEVTSPKGWIALIAIGVLLGCALVWGIWGTVPTKVQGQGILIKSGGIVRLLSPSSGVLKDIYFDVDDIVYKGQTVARIAQPQLIERINGVKKKLKELKDKYKRVKEFGTEEMRLEFESMKQQEANIKYAVKIRRERIKWLKERLKNQEELFREGLIVKQELLKTQEQINETKGEIKKLLNQLQQIKIKRVRLEAQKEEKLKNLELQINETKRLLAQLQDELDEKSKVVSPWSGRILEVSVNQGDMVTKGTPLLRLELIGKEVKNLEAVLYFPPSEGKRIKRGMKVQISPTTVKQEEYGFMLGIVTYVSDFPVSTQAMMKVVQNEELVRRLSMGMAPIEVRADLIPDPNTPSGYKWSSSKGPPMKIQPGTLCFSSVTVEEQRPISLVIPIIKKSILGIGEKGI